MDTGIALLPFGSDIFIMTLPLACDQPETSYEEDDTELSIKDEKPYSILAIDFPANQVETCHVGGEGPMENHTKLPHAPSGLLDIKEESHITKEEGSMNGKSGPGHQTHMHLCSAINSNLFPAQPESATEQEEDLRYKRLCAQYDEIQRQERLLHTLRNMRFLDGCVFPSSNPIGTPGIELANSSKNS